MDMECWRKFIRNLISVLTISVYDLFSTAHLVLYLATFYKISKRSRSTRLLTTFLLVLFRQQLHSSHFFNSSFPFHFTTDRQCRTCTLLNTQTINELNSGLVRLTILRLILRVLLTHSSHQLLILVRAMALRQRIVLLLLSKFMSSSNLLQSQRQSPKPLS